MFQLTRFSHNTVFSRNQNARYAGTRCRTNFLLKLLSACGKFRHDSNLKHELCMKPQRAVFKIVNIKWIADWNCLGRFGYCGMPTRQVFRSWANSRTALWNTLHRTTSLTESVLPHCSMQKRTSSILWDLICLDINTHSQSWQKFHPVKAGTLKGGGHTIKSDL